MLGASYYAVEAKVKSDLLEHRAAWYQPVEIEKVTIAKYIISSQTMYTMLVFMGPIVVYGSNMLF